MSPDRPLLLLRRRPQSSGQANMPFLRAFTPLFPHISLPYLRVRDTENRSDSAVVPSLIMLQKDEDYPQLVSVCKEKYSVGAQPVPFTQNEYARTRISAKTPFWMLDEQFVKSKIFQSRIHRAATSLQTAVRRYLQRDRIHTERESVAKATRLMLQHGASIRIQAVVRGMGQRHLLKTQYAARRIQTVFRGWLKRRKYTVIVLEKKLAEVESRRSRELEDVMSWKTKQQQVFRAQQEEKNDREIDCKIELAKIGAKIERLRAENIALQSQNEKVSIVHRELTAENEEIAQRTLETKDATQELRESTTEMEEQMLRAQRALQVLKKMKGKYDSGIEKHNSKADLEARISHAYLRTVSNLLSHTQTNCSETDLREEIMDLGLALFVT